MTHELKCWPNYFEAIRSGDKPFDIRDNSDRGFQKGDTVIQREFDPKASNMLSEKAGPMLGVYTGKVLKAEISYVTGFNQREGYVVFGMKNVEVLQS